MVVEISNLYERLNLDLAWRRTKKDLRINGFFYHPFELELIEYHLDDWIATLQNKIYGGYNPNNSEIIDVPKPNWHLRKGSILSLEDSVVYSSLILESINEIKNNIDWSSQSVRFSNDLINNDGNTWINPQINGWSKFRDDSNDLIEEGYKIVLFTDISSFYDTIEIKRLMSNMASFGVERDTKELLTRCLQTWAHPKDIGIPQGFKPSDILSEVYLDSIDKRLDSDGFTHLRYNDDMRIFCESKDDAIDAMYHLTGLYREKGLNLQTAKSLILEAEEAIQKMNGHTQIIAEIKDSLTYNIDPSMNPVETYEEEEDDELDIDALTEAFYEYVQPNTSENFNSTVFHYVINRFASAEVDDAIEYCLDLIIEQPTETKYILDKYFSCMGDKNEIGIKLAQMLIDKKIRLHYQKFLILKWIWENEVYFPEIYRAIRQFIREEPIHYINLDYGLAYLGKYGEYDVYDFIYSYYTRVEKPISKATILISIKNMERGQRNVIYGPYTHDPFLNLAIEYAKSN